MTLAYHIPVLAEESIEGMNSFPAADVVDATFGGAGHSNDSRKISNGRLFAFDQDEDAAENALNDKRFCSYQAQFQVHKEFSELLRS